MSNIRKRIVSSFKKRGLSLSPPALHALLNILSHSDQNQQNQAAIISNLLDEIKESLMDSSDQGSDNLVVSKDFLEKVVASITRDGKDVMEEALQLIDLTSGVPKLHYHTMKRRFELLPPSSSKGYFGSAGDKVDMLLQRYALIYQRLMRQEHFKPKLVQASSAQSQNQVQQVKITPIEGLLGSKGVKILLGIITQVEEGTYYLEDPTAQIPINLSQGEFLSDGFITEHSIVLVEGEIMDGVLYVKKIGQPLYETRKDAIAAIGLQHTDLFGAIPTLAELSKLQEEEVKHGEDGLFVILSDVHLDDARVLEKLEKLFEGFEDFDPLPVFCFMGDFAAMYPSAVQENGNATIAGYFDDLANIICKFPRIAKEGKFILVPGQNDPGIGKILPRPQIPNFFTAGLRSKVKHVHMASNPCRLRFFSQEFVIGRLDVMSKLRQECLVPPVGLDEIENVGDDGENDDVDMDEEEKKKEDGTKKRSHKTNPLVQHAIRTMLDQGHLCPVPPSSLPINWKHDHLMRLYPPPNAIILGDKSTEAYYETYVDCDVMNPGAFHTNGEFLVFRPVDMSSGERKGDCDFSQID
jgi:DNA polymerase epsilon subunit 2